MRRLALALTLCGAVATSGCTATITSSPGANSSMAPAPSNLKSQIVAEMFNSYEERSELPIDACQDSFIRTMAGLGYTLSGVVEPNTSFDYGYWFTACSYRGENSSMTAAATNSPNLAAQLKPADGAFLESYATSINDRFTVVRPSIDTTRDCWIGMETTFGSIIVTGGPLPDKSSQGTDACADMTDFLRQLEPLLGD